MSKLNSLIDYRNQRAAAYTVRRLGRAIETLKALGVRHELTKRRIDKFSHRHEIALPWDLRGANAALKAAGYRWMPEDRVWAAKPTDTLRVTDLLKAIRTLS